MLDAIRDVEGRMQAAEKQDIHALPIRKPRRGPGVSRIISELMGTSLWFSPGH